MTRLTSIIFAIAAPTLMGVAIIAALSAGYDTLQPILIAAGVGFVAPIPAAPIIARKLASL